MEAENVVHLKFNQAVELLMSKWESECVNERNGKSKQKKMKIKKKMTESIVPWRYSPRFSGRRSLSA